MAVVKVTAETPFAIVPEWVLDADISAGAVRLYGVLARYADGDQKAYPSHRKLSERLRVSERSVRGYISELEEIGALTRRQRGQGRSAEYVIHAVPARQRPSGQEDESGNELPPDPECPATDFRPSPATDCRQNESQGNESHLEPLPGPGNPASNGRDGTSPDADRIARVVWEHRPTRPMCGFPAVRVRAQEALDAGWEPESVTAALIETSAFTRNAIEFQLKQSSKNPALYDGISAWLRRSG